MKKIIPAVITGVAMLATSLPFSSCSKDFLDTKQLDLITEEERQELSKDNLNAMVQATLLSSYDALKKYRRSHDDWGLRALQLALDMYSEDIAYRGGWFQFDYNYGNYGTNYRRTGTTWDVCYDVISNANKVIFDYFPGDGANDTPEQKMVKSIPMALRGIMYYHLVNFYQMDYKIDPEALGVPIPMSPEDGDLARSTVKEVYARIISDLTYAVENGAVTPDRTDADRAVAAAYLAKAYAHMDDWANVEKYAKIAQEGGADAVISYPPSWSVNRGDVLWGFDVTPATDGMWASFYAHMDPTINYYAGGGQYKYIYNWLYAQMGAKDVRRTLYVNQEEHPAIAKEVDYEDRADKDGNVTSFKYLALKFKTTEGSLTDYIFLRVQDPILLEIEAINEQGRTADAATMLNTFVRERDPEFVAATTQEELRQQIRLQRRIELWGEGTSYFDNKRWDATVDRTKGVGDEKTNHGTVLTEKSNDPKNRFYLPLAEITNNKLLIQNE